jgi:aspartyl-tRNA(Asn)/glutamyl-tRNA(Gln) amidotransferase subunit A
MGVSKLRLGVPRNYFFERIDPEVEDAVRASIDVLGKMDAKILEVDVPFLEHTMAVEFAIIAGEATAYHEKSLRKSAKLYDRDVRTHLELGELLPSRYYLKAQRVRGLINTALEKALKEADLLVTPTAPVPPARQKQREFRFDGGKETVLYTYVRYCCPFNLAGLPAISVPCGFTRNNLPIGLQIAGRAFDEGNVLRVAQAYESATKWHRMNPPI